MPGKGATMYTKYNNEKDNRLSNWGGFARRDAVAVCLLVLQMARCCISREGRRDLLPAWLGHPLGSGVGGLEVGVAFRLHRSDRSGYLGVLGGGYVLAVANFCNR